MPIRIALDARPLAGPPCGFTNYIGAILACLRQGDFEITLISNQPLLDQYDEDVAGLERNVFGRPGDVRWEQTDLPRFLDDGDFHLYVSAANRGIPALKRARTRYVLVLYDVIPYLFYRDYYLRQWRIFAISREMQSILLANVIAAARADAILTISQQSAADIRRIFRRRSVTPILIPLRGVEHRAPIAPRPQFVYVGGTDFRKRLDSLLHGFALFGREHPDHKLVLVGWNFGGIETLIERLDLEGRVELTGYVDEATKFRILGESLAMVYPSLYEGYGLAIAEGFQARIPVIAGTGGSQGEVGGQGIRQIDPQSPADIAQAMTEMLDTDTRAEWIARGDEQLTRLSDPSIEKDILEYFTEQGRLARSQRS
ncbi:glycosyltransferase family 4 protein [Williamsia sp. MIQD14]|uniref:glycosyltransferase family 4 protein n=1 Tax=Williamsia sp. MIQD14 TaxID=3425703 RepID=UPI003DA05990